VRVAGLPSHHVALDAEGWAVTTVARTAADLAAELPLPGALAVVDAAARLLCASMVPAARRSDYANRVLGDAARELLREAASGRRGLAAARSAIDLADPRRESPIESLTAAAIHVAGLPMPQFQAPIRTPFGTLYPDCLWPEQRLVGEADGAVKYDDRDAVVREKEREQVLRDLGFQVVRWLGKEITLRPDLVVARIARALASAS
jgi:very-short-patch-repair endonuclease